MSNSAKLGLPYLQASQAQKHVTVNESLELLDAVTQLQVLSIATSVPPGTAAEGDCYAVPPGASGDWTGQNGQLAIWANGGWVYCAPLRGWRAWVGDQGNWAAFDGSAWRVGAIALSANNAITVEEIVEVEHTIVAGSSNTVAGAIPAGSVVTGVSGVVTTGLSGALATWRIGVAGSDNRYGSGLGIAQGAWLSGVTSSPLAYYSDTDLLLSGEGGDFASGQIRLCVHLRRLVPPTA